MFDLVEFAGELYTTYCESVGGKAHDGQPLPSWEVFKNDPLKLRQYNAWIATAHQALNSLRKVCYPMA
jgi:hypothetical protein